jgi:P27 family predicted phage terminase small subunit
VPAAVKAEFAQLVKLLGPRARSEDSYLLTLLATSWHTWRAAQADVERLGNVVDSEDGKIANPALAVAAQAHNQIVGLCDRLMITPKTRKGRP